MNTGYSFSSPEIIIVEPSPYHSLFVVTEMGSCAANAALDIPDDNSDKVTIAKKNFPKCFMLTELRHFQGIYVLIEKKSNTTC